MSTSLKEQLLASYNAVRRRPVADCRWVDVAAVAPYLTEEQAGQGIRDVAGGSDVVSIAGPPISVQGALNIFWVRRAATGRIRLSYAYPVRRRGSYVPAKAPRFRYFDSFAHEEEAQNYASANWGRDLVWDRAEAKVVFHVIAPPGRTRACPRLAHGVCWLSTSYPLPASRREPPSQLFDDAICRSPYNVVCASWLPFPAAELLGHYARADIPHLHFCALCSGGIAAATCRACGACFPGLLAATRFPMPCALVELYPHSFSIDPAIARLLETEGWASQQRNRLLPSSDLHGQRHRVIQIDEEGDEADAN